MDMGVGEVNGVYTANFTPTEVGTFTSGFWRVLHRMRYTNQSVAAQGAFISVGTRRASDASGGKIDAVESLQASVSLEPFCPTGVRTVMHERKARRFLSLKNPA